MYYFTDGAFFTDGALDVAKQGVKWIPDPDVLKERQEMAIRRRVELTNHNVPCEPPCNECPVRNVCNMECSSFTRYLNAPLSQCKRLL